MRARRGFTVVELMAVLAIVAVLSSMALADLRDLVRHQQLKAATGDLFGAIELARSHAVARASRVYLAPADAAGGDWEKGWVVYVDRDGDARPGANDEFIAVRGPLPNGIAIRTTFSTSRVPDYLAFNGAGRGCTDASSQAARWGTLSLFLGERTRRIKINMLGRARVCDPARDGASCPGADLP
jgi:type IV fimbrial biogenesis protein FimT